MVWLVRRPSQKAMFNRLAMKLAPPFGGQTKKTPNPETPKLPVEGLYKGSKGSSKGLYPETPISLN